MAPVVYLNNAGQAPLSEAVKAAGKEALERPPWEMHADQAKLRNLFASLIGATSDRIAIMPSTAFAITLAADNVLKTVIDSGRQGKVLVLADQMCSAVYAWEQESGGKISLEILPYPTTNGGWTESVLEKIQTDCDIVVACLPQLHWADGAMLDLTAIGAACRARNVVLIVDATQSIGIMSFDVNEIQSVFVACSVHKWLRGPPGCSLVYVSNEVQETWQPLDQHGRSRKIAIDGGSSWDASKDEMGPNGYPTEFCKDARKFDSGGKPNPILLPMLNSSLEQVAKLDVPLVQQQMKQLTQPILDWASKNDFVTTPGPLAGHLVGIRPASSRNLTPERLIQIACALQSEGIYIAVRCGAFRISPYVDTKESDIQQLLEALGRHCG